MSYLSSELPILFVATALLSAVIGLLLRPLALKLNWIDHPGVRKVHAESTPWIGGLVIFLAVAVSVVLFPGPGLLALPFTSTVLICATLLLLVGAIDDSRGLSPTLRFLLQMAACLHMPA